MHTTTSDPPYQARLKGSVASRIPAAASSDRIALLTSIRLLVLKIRPLVLVALCSCSLHITLAERCDCPAQSGYNLNEAKDTEEGDDDRHHSDDA